jgi:hypothetical protein
MQGIFFPTLESSGQLSNQGQLCCLNQSVAQQVITNYNVKKKVLR